MRQKRFSTEADLVFWELILLLGGLFEELSEKRSLVLLSLIFWLCRMVLDILLAFSLHLLDLELLFLQ